MSRCAYVLVLATLGLGCKASELGTGKDLGAGRDAAADASFGDRSTVDLAGDAARVDGPRRDGPRPDLRRADGPVVKKDGPVQTPDAPLPKKDTGPTPDLGTTLKTEQPFPTLTFQRPVDLRHAGDGTNRLFVVEQRGRILVFPNQASPGTPSVFLDIQAKVRSYDDAGGGNEQGLFGVAFHPSYSTNGFFYVTYTAEADGRTIVSRFKVSTGNPNQADTASELELISHAQPASNHNGGGIAFGPDGYLYVSRGDGGSTPQNGQSLTTLLGKILRIDVNNTSAGKNYAIPADNPFAGNTSGYREEIWAYGLRNTWRFSFDPVTKWLWAGDVGQGSWEEIDIIQKGKNYGWAVMEGKVCYNSPNCNQTGLEPPIWVYPRPGGGSSVTGGYVYRGTKIPGLVGHYVYADYVSGQIWRLTYDGVNPAQNVQLFDMPTPISSFGVDQQNELYFLGFDGKIYRFTL